MSATSAIGLVGREQQLRALDELVDGVGDRGGALLLRGEPGIGKSALLEHAAERARALGLLVLTTTGVQSEAHLPFAGLHQLLRPLLGGADELPPPQRAALLAAFGMVEGAAPDVFLIALGALELLSDQAAETPLLLVVEDTHWLDDPTCDVLAFVGRRLEAEPIVLLMGTREESSRVEAGLDDLRLDGLAEPDAASLLDAGAPDLAPEVRRRLLEDARGNPLALEELPGALAYEQLHGRELLPDPLPLTARLERAFAVRVSELPPAAREVLVAAAADDGGVLSEVLGAAGTSVDALAPAVSAGLVEARGDRLRFRHPLVRSAVYQSASAAERRAAHAALARQLASDPDRSVWHRAAAASGPDEQVALELEEAAARARRRGAPATAAAALERAAKLTADEAGRGGLLLRAAEMEFELGRLDRSIELLAEAKPLDLGREERARLSFLVEMFEDGGWSGASRVSSFAELADQMTDAGEPERALRALEMVALRCYWGNPDQATRDRVVEVAERIPVAENDATMLGVLALADPVRQGAPVLERLARRSPEDGTDPAELSILGAAANAVWAFDVGLGFFDSAVDGLRAQGRLGLLAQALTGQAWAAVHLAREGLAMSAADEATSLARETRQPRWALSTRLAQATVHAERGDLETAEQLAREAEAELLPMGANPMLALVQFVRGRGAVAHQLYDDGLDHLRRIFDPADVAYHPFVGAWALSDLVEAAAHTGNRESAEGFLAQLESLVAATPGSLLVAELAYARAILADDEGAQDAYQAGLGTGLANWPCYRGRLLLAYGAWLRRQRRVAESRAPLRAAKEIFDALRFTALAERACQELRASGETSRTRTPDAWDELSPQERQIAQMAAEGLTNREIGQKLYLSHRTVGSHLYRMFPKLGITSRGQLATALQSSD
ncbi:MAG TPA: AAA family ATPase [Gaiellaceae bacterium]